MAHMLIDWARWTLLLMACAAWACAGAAMPPPKPQTHAASSQSPKPEEPMTCSAEYLVTFGEDLKFMQEHTELVVLRDAQGLASVAVAPEYQGRVMTSSAAGDSGASFGWINREVIASKAKQPHMNVFGGEDRFWLGPEGGQFGLYFAKGSPFDLDHWQVPAALDWGAWPIVERTATEVAFERNMTIKNHAGTTLSLLVQRRIRLLDAAAMVKMLGGPPPEDAIAVGYESINTITNRGKGPWTKEAGLVSIWILGMYPPSSSTTVVIPFRTGARDALGPVVNDSYFGKVPEDRLTVGEGVLYFRGDGQRRGKIGIPRPRAKSVLGSYDAAQQILTLVQFSLPKATHGYVNSMWEQQAEPYAGDVVNSYNDGPPAPGQKPLGPFYELETSSPAAALAPGQSLTHVQRTIHLQAIGNLLDPVAKRLFGVDLSEIEGALKSSAP